MGRQGSRAKTADAPQGSPASILGRFGAGVVSEPDWDVLNALTEREFQRMVVDGLRQRGYLVWVVPDMRKTLAGLPDIIAVSPHRVTRPRRVLMWELKTMRGRVRPAQKLALAALDGIAGVDARIVRPSDWPAVLEIAPATEARGGEGV
jgi:hypothetical protein